MSKTCLACNKKLANKYTLARHSKICKRTNIKININDYNKKIKALEDKINNVIKEINIIKERLNNKDIEILDLKEKISYILLNMPNNKNKD